MKPVFIYITDGYPYNAAEIFPGDELPFLTNQGWEIFIMPTSRGDSADSISLPEGIKLSNDLVATKWEKIVSLLSLKALTLLVKEYKSYRTRHLYFPLKRALGAIATCLTAKKNLRRFISTNRLDSRAIVVYNYWCNSVAFGASLLRNTMPSACFISRVHGYELFSEQCQDGYLPFRFLRIRAFNKIIAVSNAGIDQLLKDGHCEAGVGLYYLGVPKPKGLAVISSENKFFFVSCSNMAQVKRLPLLVSSIKEYSISHPELSVDWQHYGGGNGFEEFEKLAYSELSQIPNLTFKLHGQLAVEQVRQRLAVNCGDVFINISLSEGGVPVSLQEAGCSGIPLLATDAGGNREIVNEETGILLPLEFSQQDFTSALDHLQTWKTFEKRIQLSAYCLKKFSQEQNYKKFVEEVLKPLFKEAESKHVNLTSQEGEY